LDVQRRGGDHSLSINEQECTMSPLNLSDDCLLAKGLALTFCPRSAGHLRVGGGRAWVTFDITKGSPVADAGDHFVIPGRDLPVRAGQSVVIESWPQAGGDSIRLMWVAQERPSRVTNLLLRLKQRLAWLPLGQPARL
jgi:hypothetical protein